MTGSTVDAGRTVDVGSTGRTVVVAGRAGRTVDAGRAGRAVDAGGAGAEAVEPKGDLYVWLIPAFPPEAFSLSEGDVGEE